MRKVDIPSINIEKCKSLFKKYHYTQRKNTRLYKAIFVNGKSPKKIDTLIFIANQFHCSIYEIINQDYIKAIKEELKNVQTVGIKTKKIK